VVDFYSGVDIRGGSWNYDPRNLRSANRNWDSTVIRYFSYGFRIARTF
jgi:formylglycine-generating enzyme required for sulfatase activity